MFSALAPAVTHLKYPSPVRRGPTPSGYREAGGFPAFRILGWSPPRKEPLSGKLPAPKSPCGSLSGRKVRHMPRKRAGSFYCLVFPEKARLGPIAGVTRWSLAHGIHRLG